MKIRKVKLIFQIDWQLILYNYIYVIIYVTCIYVTYIRINYNCVIEKLKKLNTKYKDTVVALIFIFEKYF